MLESKGKTMENSTAKTPLEEIVSQEYAAKLASSFAGLMTEMVHQEKAQIVEGYLAVSQAMTDLSDRMDSNLNPIRLGLNFSNNRKGRTSEPKINPRDAIKEFAVNKGVVHLRFATEILRDDSLAEPLKRLVEAYGYDVSDSKALLDAVRDDIKARFEVKNRFDRLPVDKAQVARYAEDASHPIHGLVHPKPEQSQGFTI